METNKLYFNYFFLFLFFLFLSTHFNLSFNLFFWILISAFIIFIINNFYNQQFIDNTNKNIQKFNNIFPNHSDKLKFSLFQKYTDFNDFLFYLLDIKHFNSFVFDNIISDLNKFLILYEQCFIDLNLINSNFNKMIDIRQNTLKNIESIFISNSNSDFSKFNSNILRILSILNKYIDNIVLLQNKNIYYNGYNIYTKIIDNYPVTEFNRNFNNFNFI
jgi:hypothetical protein